jgi:hypothetical protein
MFLAKHLNSSLYTNKVQIEAQIMKEPRKTLQINESVFNEFNTRKEALGVKNSSELLQTLLQTEICRTETTMLNRIEQIGDFDNEVKKISKKGSDKI